MVRADHLPVGGGLSQGSQPIQDGRVCCFALADVMHFHGADLVRAGMLEWGLIKENLNPAALDPAVGLQQRDQLIFIIQVGKRKSGDVRDEVMSINQQGHGIILPVTGVHTNLFLICAIIQERQPMNPWKRALPFFLINIFLSALTTLVVLTIWNASHPQPESESPEVDQTIAPLGECVSSNPSLDSAVIEISGVVGVGELDKEEVDLRRVGSGDLCLNGWQLMDENGHRYTFPPYFQVYSDGVVIRLYTREGDDDPLRLFWGLTQPLLSPGETVTLVDGEGNARAVFEIPEPNP
jgi:hypothetical protein